MTWAVGALVGVGFVAVAVLMCLAVERIGGKRPDPPAPARLTVMAYVVGRRAAAERGKITQAPPVARLQYGSRVIDVASRPRELPAGRPT
jgi:hypothetical protein